MLLLLTSAGAFVSAVYHSGAASRLVPPAWDGGPAPSAPGPALTDDEIRQRHEAARRASQATNYASPRGFSTAEQAAGLAMAGFPNTGMPGPAR